MFRVPNLKVLAALIVAACLAGGIFYKIDSERVQERLLADTMARNDLRAKQLADSVAQQTVALIRLFDMALLQLRQPFISGGLDAASVADIIMRGLPPGAVNLVFATDEHGNLVYSSDHASQNVNMADRAYFRFFADGGEDRLYIGTPFKGRLGAKNWVIPFSRVIQKNGRFAGVVVVGLLPEYLSNSLVVLSLNPGDIVAVVDHDGNFFARSHRLQDALGRKTPADRPFLDPARSDSETFRAMSSVDATPVDFAWKRLSEWPLISVVALDERSEIGPIRTAIAATALRVNLILAAVASFSLAIAGLLLWAQRQQRQLVASESLLTSVMDSLRNNIAVLDDQGRIIQVNAEWRNFARDNAALPHLVDGVGLNYFDACREAAEDDPLAAAALDGMMAVLVGRQRRYCQEYPCHSPTETRWFEFGVTPLVGKQRGLVTSHVDITERKLDRQRLEKLLAEQKIMLENQLVGIVMVANRTIIWANPAFEQMLGYGPGELVGAPTRANYPSEQAYLSIGAEAEPILNAGHVFRTQLEHVRKDGGHIWVDASCAILDRDKGMFLWGFIDITERKTLELTLKRSNAELEQFAYVASHDMRQPLRMVTSYLGLIEKRLGPLLTDEIKPFFGFAVDGAKHMDHLILDLLEYSRTGRVAKTVPVPLGEVVADALVNLTVAIREAAAEVVVAADLPTVKGDPTELTRLFQNLIGNAVKYRAPDRRPRIAVDCRRQGREWRVSVSDNGIGIAEDDRDRAFAIFQRLVPQGQYEGTGIGLAVCKKIVEHHGGRIWIDSVPGDGATFHFTLPDATAIAPPARAELSAPPASL